MVFGEPFQTSLEPLPNPSIDLKKSVAELWDTYRALLRDLIADPTQAQKCERIRELLTLLHQQINYYRDVQAQESLDLIRRQQIQARRNLKDRIDELEERTRKEYREIASEIRKVL